MNMQTKISRRTMIRTMAGAGGGMILGFHLPGASAGVVAPEPWTTPTDGAEINAWLTIDLDGTVTIRVPHTEQGQGALTSVPTMIAEELDVPWENVRAVFADMNRHLNQGQEYKVTTTHGSQVVRLQHPHIMQAGASARERLKAAAAIVWNVDPSQVTAKQGVLSSGSNQASYADFVTAAAEVQLAQEPTIKTPDQWWLMGKPLPRMEIPHKVNGSAQYSIDTRLDGMVYAAVKCCPVPWGKVKSYDFDAVRNRPGIIDLVEFHALEGKTFTSDMQNGVAIVADSWYRAKTALDLMPIEWDYGPNANVSNETQAAEAQRLFGVEGDVSNEIGSDALGRINQGGNTLSAQYHRPYETHARMEPINATVSVTDERIDVWSPTQDQAAPLRIISDHLGRDTKEIFVHTAFLGGAFGGNGGGATAVTKQAAEISNRLRRPVKVIWTREEDITHDKQRPPVYTELKASLGERGLPEAFFSRAVWFTHEGVANHGPATADYSIGTMPYLVPNRRHERHNVATHLPTATHRGPGANQNGFIIEQFVDEMALAADWDPLEWRLEMTKGLEPWQRVLLKMKEVCGFRTDLPKGQGMGIAVVEDHNSYCGACATVSVSQRGQLTIDKLDIIINSGYLINELNASEQLEGAACWELSHALYGGLDLENGQFTNTNFDSYHLMRMPQMPSANCYFALSEDGWWGGMGEPGGPPTPAAVANAIYFATGKRVRSTPINQHDLSWS
ncbi:MAG: xanthine dehydrogenase family protein molybdopterin-binding subunit [Halieaceae bacterium]|jgi:isoquinoline 1-oxidoreductase subunit beta|nr:xanthine dehydrogenase family protein molybdopterin-binding subunit [Halieaceae bacterium]MBT5331803.1 xanthine dehydrogenase family protein molybdopterin-binding subunit [Porticoccaceae bacterium]